MFKEKKSLLLFLLFISIIIVNSSCVENRGRRDEFVSMPTDGDSLMVKISYPASVDKNSRIIIWNSVSLIDQFIPDSLPNGRVDIQLILRDSLLNDGFISIEYLGRNDSVVSSGIKFRKSDKYTKAEDFESVLKFVRSQKEFQKREIILIGHSEGGAINAIAASRHPEDISAIVQLAACAINGKKNSDYQALNNDSIFFYEHGFMFEHLIKISSLHSVDYEHSLECFRRFGDEVFGPLIDMINCYEDWDTIVSQAVLCLESRWEREDLATRELHGDFEGYCRHHDISQILSPHQAATRKWNPELYYPHIKCPVLAVYGTEDKRVEWSSSEKAMESFLKEAGNTNYKSIVLEGYGHSLTKKHDRSNHYIEDNVIRDIFESIRLL